MVTFNFGSSQRRGRQGKMGCGGRIGLFLFGSIFFAMGTAFFYFVVVLPVVNMIAARSWTQVPCVIVSSEVETHADGDGDTYSIEISFRYEFNEQTYQSDQYSFIDMSSSGYDGKRRVVDQYPTGHDAMCWVNPSDPKEAVIHRGWSHVLWFGLIPLIFVAVGLAIMAGGVFGGRQSRGLAGSASHVDWMPDSKYRVEGGRIVLRPTASRIVKLIGVLFAALFWNGITSIFVYHAVTSHLEGDPEWFLTFFIIPFVLVGLGLIGAVVYQLLALFNPKFELTLNTAEIHLGDPLEVAWQIHGSVHRLKQITIELVGEESATYQRGTDTHTDTHVFMTQTLFETEAGVRNMQPNGSSELTIPGGVPGEVPGTMHSFVSGNNKITWMLRVRGDVPRWPDVKADYPIVIAPRGFQFDKE